MKQCKYCGISKPYSEFPDLVGATDGKNAYCQTCFALLVEDETVANFRLENAGYVYLVRGANLVKIGVAKDPEKRLGYLQIGSPVPLRLICKKFAFEPYELEVMLHKAHAEHRKHGEWFEWKPIRKALLSLFK